MRFSSVHRVFVLVSMFSLLLSGCAHRADTAVTASEGTPLRVAVGTDELPFQQIPLGLCEDYPKSTRTLESARRDLDVAQRAGATVLRISFSWLDMEPAPGQYDFSFWDDYVRMAHERGIRLIPYVCYTPMWAASTQDPATYWKAPPRDAADFGKFVAALVRRYRTTIRTWELWNEPDNPAYWNGSTHQFAALIKAGSQAVRATDPSAKVVLGGIAWNPAYVATLLRDEGLSPYVDIINIHAYFETWHEDSMELMPDYINRVADIVARYGHQQPLWMAEVGYSSYRGARQGREISEQYIARFDYEHTGEYQAQALTRTIALALATGKISLLAWYRINDLPAETGIIGDVNNRHLGLIDTLGRPKPALAAFTRVTEMFSQPWRCIDERTLIVRPMAAGVEAHSFEFANGQAVILLWQRTHLAGDEARPTAEMQAPVAVILPPSEHRAGTIQAVREGHAPIALKRSPLGPGLMLGHLRPRRDQLQIFRIEAKAADPIPQRVETSLMR